MEPIIAHVRERNFNEVKEWIDNPSTDLDVGDEHGFSLLHWAAREGCSEIAEMLLRQGARVNVTNAGLDTPLHLAAAHGHFKLVKLLYEYSIQSVDIGNEYGNTPLHYACFWGHVDIADYLMENGAYAEMRNEDGKSPLDVTPIHLHERIRNKAVMPDLVMMFPHTKNAREFQAEETRSKDGVLFREENKWEPKQIETKRAMWGTNPFKYYHGVYQGNSILIKMVELAQVSQRIDRDVKEETAKLRIFNHRNLLPVLGCMVSDSRDKICLFTENVTIGPLFDVIHDPGFSHEINERQALKFAVDIARGMTFLHTPELKISSFRLNSKNVMVTDDLSHVRITGDEEFDLCPEKRHQLDHEYFMARLNLAECKVNSLFKGREYFPAWMSPEALKNKMSDINHQASDVWSFGVILWELETRNIPFNQIEPMVVGIQIATESLRLPPCTPNERINRLFKLCTNNEPKNRPRFDMLVPILDKMLDREALNLKQ
ncbi:Ankyrin-2 [Cichlidogyrus casuarinus]|uniref:Ankyrin-2 n=1 Tax=Cichlidogyrus casuarinus TaxID=1844966 RepID=A0ABD2PZD8_9PLAT